MTTVLKTVDQFVAEYENGDYQGQNYSGVIVADPRTPFFSTTMDEDKQGAWITWFDDEAKDGYDAVDGFYPGGSRFEFTLLWYGIVADFLEHYELGNWQVEHGGSRFVYSYGATDEQNLRAHVETFWPLAYNKYIEVTQKLLARGNKKYVRGC